MHTILFASLYMGSLVCVYLTACVLNCCNNGINLCYFPWMHSFSLFTGHGKWRWRLSIKSLPEKDPLLYVISPSTSLLFVLNLPYCSECISNTLSCSITVEMNFFSFSWNSIKHNISGTKLIELDDCKANAAIFKYPSLPSCYWSGCRNPLYAAMRCCKDSALCCPQLQDNVGMMWKAVLWGENAVHCVQWWLMNVIHCHIQTSASNSLSFLLSLLLATSLLSHFGVLYAL